MRKRTLKEKFYTGCGYSIFGALAFAFFLELSIFYAFLSVKLAILQRLSGVSVQIFRILGILFY